MFRALGCFRPRAVCRAVRVRPGGEHACRHAARAPGPAGPGPGPGQHFSTCRACTPGLCTHAPGGLTHTSAPAVGGSSPWPRPQPPARLTPPPRAQRLPWVPGRLPVSRPNPRPQPARSRSVPFPAQGAHPGVGLAPLLCPKPPPADAVGAPFGGIQTLAWHTPRPTGSSHRPPCPDCVADASRTLHGRPGPRPCPQARCPSRPHRGGKPATWSGFREAAPAAGHNSELVGWAVPRSCRRSPCRWHSECFRRPRPRRCRLPGALQGLSVPQVWRHQLSHVISEVTK